MIAQRFAALAILAVPGFAQDQTGAKALFLDPTSGVSVQSSSQTARPQAARKSPSGQTVPGQASTVQVATAPPKEGEVTGLRYWMELQTEQGQLLRVNSSRAFKSGERIRIHVESNVDGSLVILQSQDGGPFGRLFPNGTASGRVERFKDQVFPSKNGWFRFDAKPGDLRLMLMVTAEANPNTTPVQLASSRTSPAARGLSDEEDRALEKRMRDQIERLRGSKALIVEEDSVSAESYVVNDARKATNIEPGIVALELKLTHR